MSVEENENEIEQDTREQGIPSSLIKALAIVFVVSMFLVMFAKIVFLQ